jgi:hypothetical protein
MSAIYFDTLAYAKKLTKAGFTEKQAETLAHEQSNMIKEDLVTKDVLHRELVDLEQRLTIKMGGMLAVSIAIIAAMIKLI